MATLCQSCDTQEKQLSSTPLAQDSVVVSLPEPEVLFGIVVDSLDVNSEKIGRNEMLSQILTRYNVPYSNIAQLAKNSKKVFDVRKLRSGKEYTVLSARDSARTAKYFIYDSNLTEYVVYSLDDLSCKLYQRPVDTILRTAAGVIDNSLYMTLQDAGANPLLTHNLSQIFAWQIDFFRIQKGDSFKVIYEETSVNGQPVGISKVVGAVFSHFGNDYYAINFERDGTEDFYDEKGGSIRKAFLKAPLNYSRISSRYTMRRYHPVQKRYKAHLGTDYAAPRGTPIVAVGDGVITDAQYKIYNGNYVKIRHNGTYTTQYLHMDKIAKGMRSGKHVKQGDVIGYVGSTGLATGPHLCYRFWMNGKQVDALRVKIPASEPLPAKYMAEYKNHRDEILAQLDRISLNGELEIRPTLASLDETFFVGPRRSILN